MNTLELREWIKKNNIEERTIESFKVYLNNYLSEEPEVFYEQFGNVDKKLIEVKITKIALTIVNWPDDYINDCIIVFADINYINQNIAEYKLIFNLSGEIIDDYLLKVK